jgi:pentatricopeptide repeat protein
VDRGIATKTLAELYLSQGNVRKALEIYHEILKREPSNREIREAIKTLEKKTVRHSGGQAVGHARDLTKIEKIKTLKQWLRTIQTVQEQRREKDRN